MKSITQIFFILLAIILTSCASDGHDKIVIEEEANPIARSVQFFGQGGNLWKPVGDDHGAGAGNLVVLLDASFTKRFDSCEIVLNTGETRQLTCIDTVEWTHTPYSCFANGNRQHWRADFKCSSARAVEVVCRDFNQEITFTVPDEQKGHLCSRFG